MNTRVGLLTEYGLSALKYLLSGYMMLAGILTAFGPVTEHPQRLGWLYSTRPSLVVIGLIIFVCAFTLFLGKIRKSRKWTGIGLFAVTACLMFAAILNAVAFGGDPLYWVGNTIAATVTALLWLRWKFQTKYVNPYHFRIR